MRRDEWDVVWSMLIGAWPRLDSDVQHDAWHGALLHHDYQHATSAVRYLVANRQNTPSIAHLLGAIRHEHQQRERAAAHRAVEQPRCDECGAIGFVFLDAPNVGEPGDVVRCSRGCMPPVTNEHRDRREQVERLGDATRFAGFLRAARAQQALRRQQIGTDAYLQERGFDPARYRYVDGCIVARPTGTPRHTRSGAIRTFTATTAP